MLASWWAEDTKNRLGTGDPGRDGAPGSDSRRGLLWHRISRRLIRTIHITSDMMVHTQYYFAELALDVDDHG